MRKSHGVIDSSLFHRASVLGTGYSWDNFRKACNVFLLWHTDGQIAPADGTSGAPLCLGRPLDTTALAVVFQNFQQPCLLANVTENTNTRWHTRSKWNREWTLIKAGFILPPEIRDSTILSGEVLSSTIPFNTLPAGNRGSIEHEHKRRVFSSIE